MSQAAKGTPWFKNMKIMRWVYGGAIILIGAAVALVPVIRNAITAKQVDEIATQILEGQASVFMVPVSVASEDEYEEWDINKESNQQVLPNVSPTPVPVQIELKALGVLRIPKIDSKQPLIEGAGKTELHYGVGHLIGTANVGEVGNCVVAGHRNYTYGQVWNRLNEVEVGDEVIITDTEGTEYVYSVYEILVTEPGSSEMVAHYRDTRQLTLITCDPVVIANKRLVIRCLMQ